MLGISDGIIVLIFTGYFIYSAIFKIPSRPAIIMALIFIGITAFGTLIQNTPIADRAAEIAYYLLCVGVLQQMVEIYRESSEKGRNPQKTG